MAAGQRGSLIVIEGLDRAGKSTQCSALAASLEKDGKRVKSMKFPDRTTPVGKSIDAYLKGQSQVDDHTIHLLFSANRWEAAAKIRRDIEEGFTIIIDRYSYSGAVYSAAKKKPELNLDWAWRPEVGLPRPDLVLFLDISPQVAAARRGFGDEKYETCEIQQSVRELFLQLLGFPVVADYCIAIDAGRPPEQVEKSVLDAAQALWQRGPLRSPLGSLASIDFCTS